MLSRRSVRLSVNILRSLRLRSLRFRSRNAVNAFSDFLLGEQLFILRLILAVSSLCRICSSSVFNRLSMGFSFSLMFLCRLPFRSLVRSSPVGVHPSVPQTKGLPVNYGRKTYLYNTAL